MSRVVVKYQDLSHELTAVPGQNLLEFLRRAGFPVTAPCGGNGTCGKCLVHLEQGNTAAQVPACQTKITLDCQVTVPSELGGTICTESLSVTPLPFQPRQGLGVAIDLGTTTIALRMFDLSSGQELETVSDWNHQRPYGADVITRCQYCMEHPSGLSTLSRLIWQQILNRLQQLCTKHHRPLSDITQLFVAGNTIMQHLAAGISPISISTAPFRPETLFDQGDCYRFHHADVSYAPCVSGYVGGDITAGLLACGLAQQEKPALFLDIGTNGEMALGSREGFLCCAVACGPAFEGAGISCGMSSTEGAVSHITWQNGTPVLEVIGGGAPKGVCGSGLLDLLSMLLKLGAVDESGYLLPPEDAPEQVTPWLGEDDNGNGIFYLTQDHTLSFTAADVRQLQLAKAAVAAGISVLMEHSGRTFHQVEALYLAGGFGSHLDPDSAVEIGMLPEQLRGKIIPVGNSALTGASMALLHSDHRQSLLSLQKKCRYLELSGNAAFNQLFPEHMTFDKEESPWT